MFLVVGSEDKQEMCNTVWDVGNTVVLLIRFGEVNTAATQVLQREPQALFRSYTQSLKSETFSSVAF